MAEWQDIATAPKDQTWILLYGPYNGEPRVQLAFWASAVDGEWDDGGWYDSEAASHSLTAFGWEPTHWHPFDEPTTDPCMAISDLLSSALLTPLTDGTWNSARPLYCWERDAMNYLLARGRAGTRPPINAWTAMLLKEGYPPAKAGADQGKYWKPARQTTKEPNNG